MSVVQVVGAASEGQVLVADGRSVLVGRGLGPGRRGRPAASEAASSAVARRRPTPAASGSVGASTRAAGPSASAGGVGVGAAGGVASASAMAGSPWVAGVSTVAAVGEAPSAVSPVVVPLRARRPRPGRRGRRGRCGGRLGGAGRAPSVVGDVDDHHGDVVAAPALVGQAHQLVGRLVRVSARRAGPRRWCRRSTSLKRPSLQSRKRSPVKGSTESVSTCDGLVDAEGPGEDVALRVDRGLLLAELAAAAQVLDQAVVLAELDQLAVAEQVDAGVADVDPGDLLVLGARFTRAMATSVVPMPAEVVVVGGAGEDAPVGLLHRLDHGVDGGLGDDAPRGSPPRWPRPPRRPGGRPCRRPPRTPTSRRRSAWSPGCWTGPGRRRWPLRPEGGHGRPLRGRRRAGRARRGTDQVVIRAP